MTDHEMVLLRAAVEACEGWLQVEHYPGGSSAVNRVWCVTAHGLVGGPQIWEPTLADALTALLTDLGADVPEWPSEERVAELRGFVGPTAAALPLPEYLALRGGS